MPDTTEKFVHQLTENQNRLFAYIFSLLGDHSRAADVLQETNLVLWRKLDEFRPEAPFLPWAFAVARFQVMAHLRDHKRDRCLLDAELIEAFGDQLETHAARIEETQAALRDCLRALGDENRALIEQRYFHSQSIQAIAGSLNRGVSAVKVALLRARRQLGTCIEKRLAGGTA